MARLILDPPKNAFLNMALDEALFTSAPKLAIPATLRLYGWSPHAISLGRRQTPDKVDMESCRKKGMDVVKRIGGGSAVFHGDEITYCFVCRLDAMPMPDAAAWRRVFAGFLKNLGIAADSPGQCPSATSRTDSACFSGAARDEPTIGGKKFVGNARRKSKTVFLQHGSILLKNRQDVLRPLVENASPDASMGLLEILPPLSRKRARETFIDSVADEFGLKFVPGSYTPEEKSDAARIEPLKRRLPHPR
jgi:lipoate-protein ligase A